MSEALSARYFPSGDQASAPITWSNASLSLKEADKCPLATDQICTSLALRRPSAREAPSGDHASALASVWPKGMLPTIFPLSIFQISMVFLEFIIGTYLPSDGKGARPNSMPRSRLPEPNVNAVRIRAPVLAFQIWMLTELVVFE